MILIAALSDKHWFHPFEITRRLPFAARFFGVAEQARHPTLMTVLGGVILAVGVGLTLCPPAQHPWFACYLALCVQSTFRPAGVGLRLFGGRLVCSAIAGPSTGPSTGPSAAPPPAHRATADGGGRWE